MEFVEVDARWFGPISFERVRDEEFTPGMIDCGTGLYLWTAERNGDARTLYAGKADIPTRRQRAHFGGTLGANLRRIREQRWTPLFWVAELCDDGCAEIEACEKVVIYATKPEWNRASSGYINLPFGIRLVSGGRRPPGVPRVIRKSSGRHA